MKKSNVKSNVLILKADMHLHTKDDPKDYKEVSYSSIQLIDYLDKKGFDVFSITLHEGMLDYGKAEQVRKYAKSRGMIYIPGIEQNIDGKHILIYNMDKDSAEKIKNYNNLKSTLENSKTKKVLIVAAHPYYPFFTAAGKKVNEWSKYIDCLEYNSFYPKYLNFFNERARTIARKLNKPLIGNTDAHFLEQIGFTYTNIIFSTKNITDKINNKKTFKKFVKECSDKQYDKIIKDIIDNIKEGKVELNSQPLKLGYIVKSTLKFIINDTIKT